MVRVDWRAHPARIGRLATVLAHPGPPFGLVTYIFRVDSPTIYTDREVIPGVELLPTAAEFTVILALFVNLELGAAQVGTAQKIEIGPYLGKFHMS